MSSPLLAVVGGGVAGSAAALRAAQYQIPTVWILGDSRTRKASRSAYVVNLDNMVGIHPGIMQQKIAALLGEEHPEAAALVHGTHFHISTADLIDNAKQRIEEDFSEWVTMVSGRAESVERREGGFRLSVGDGSRLEAPYLVLATGVMDRQPVVHKTKAGRDLANIHWLFPYANHETLLYCVRCEGHLVPGRRVGVIGGGAAAAEVSLMVRERYGADVALLTAGEEPSWSAAQQELLDRQAVPVHHSRLTELRGADKGATLHGFVLEDGSEVDVELAFIAMGLYRVYNDLARQLGADLLEGPQSEDVQYVCIDGKAETSVPNLFAIGDMASRRSGPVMKQVYTAQEYAVRAVDTVDRRRRREMRAALSAS